jgi:hypothetical protein
MANSLPVPGYLPAIGRPVLPWIRRHVTRVAARYAASQDDLWDEAVSAPVRASFHWQPALGAFAPYARTAVHRACWRYVIRGQATQVSAVPLELKVTGPSKSRLWHERAVLPGAFTAPSSEDEAIAREAARRALVVRQHAALADARGDSDIIPRLRDAASVAARMAHTVRRPRARA